MLTGGESVQVERILGRLAKPNTSSTERTIRKEYHPRLPERDVAARLNTGTLLNQTKTSTLYQQFNFPSLSSATLALAS